MAKILVVDDRPTNRQFLMTLLAHPDYDLFEAAHGAEALSLALIHRPDLVISDILMPVMDGCEFARKLRADPRTKATPVIFYTATYRATEAEEMARSCGVTRVLRKPGDPEVIRAAVAEELSARQSAAGADDLTGVRVERSFASQVNNANRAAGLQRLNLSLTSIVELMLEAAPEKGTEHVARLFFNAAHRMIASDYAVLAINDGAGAHSHLMTKGVDPALYQPGQAGPLLDDLMKHRRTARLPGDAFDGPIRDRLVEGHPMIRNFLGTAVASRSRVLGWLYIADKLNGEYSEEDERVLSTLAMELAVFYENAVLHDNTQQHAASMLAEVTRREQAESASRQREQQLAQSQKMETVGQLTGGIAHDFNNLLTVIKGASEDILEQHGASGLLGEQVTLIQQAAERGATLVRQLMSFSRKQELHPTTVDINKLIDTTLILLRRAIPENVAIQMAKGEGLPMVTVDSATLENVILNLSLNARDAMPGGGTLALTTSAATIDDAFVAENPGAVPGPYVVLSVKDTGTGMTEAVRLRVFEPFFTTKGVGKGTGLGLSMVYGFVKQSGGYVKIVSAPGQGTEVRIYLPQGAAAAEAPAAAASAPPRAEAGKLRVLLVEDDELVRASVATKLRRQGHNVSEVGNPGEALAFLAKDAAIDLLFTDIIMPGPLTGADLAREVMAKWPQIKVLATSGYTESTLLGKVTVPDGVRLLSKPYANAELIEAIKAVMGGAAR